VQVPGKADWELGCTVQVLPGVQFVPLIGVEVGAEKASRTRGSVEDSVKVVPSGYFPPCPYVPLMSSTVPTVKPVVQGSMPPESVTCVAVVPAQTVCPTTAALLELIGTSLGETATYHSTFRPVTATPAIFVGDAPQFVTCAVVEVKHRRVHGLIVPVVKNA
jgi:hypothetical protein